MPEMLALTEGAGGLFDFNATLPLMAIQFILLTVVLTFVFYEPVSKVIDDREIYISNNLTTSSEKLINADELGNQSLELIKRAQVNGEAIIAQSEKEAKDVVALEINDAHQDAAKLIEGTNKGLSREMLIGLKEFHIDVAIELFIETLSELIKKRLLNQEVVL
jgi:F-type H+-transporting ATPase subunit b